MIWKRQIPILIVTVVGWITILGWYIDQPDIQEFVNDDATQWFDIITGFAAFLGVISLVKLHLNKIAYKRNNWQYSIVTLVGFFIMLFLGSLWCRGNDTWVEIYVGYNISSIYIAR